MDELKLYLRIKFQCERSPIPWPFSEVKHGKTIRVFEEFYNNTENLMAISDKVASHVYLEEDETFCCFLFVKKRP